MRSATVRPSSSATAWKHSSPSASGRGIRSTASDSLHTQNSGRWAPAARSTAAASHDLRQPLQSLNLLNRAATRKAGTNTTLIGILERQQLALDSMSALLG